ncbi:Hypothetical predicted protein [Paramuricea clavata]|uniref:Uncharacterized protein n=1 Tax=Paramuricea clavata TaxID=317549 RepID=A0A6S7K3J4_PARCT|nr:Hypothetical predicted protein [Paramuricea clavata]
MADLSEVKETLVKLANRISDLQQSSEASNNSGVCRKCRDLLKNLRRVDVDELESQLKQTTLDDDDDEVMFKTPMHKTIPVTQTPLDVMVFSPSAVSELSQMKDPNITPRERLNVFLASRDVSPIRTAMNTSWHAAADRTKRHYLRKAWQVIHATLEEIAPDNSEELLRAVQEGSMGGESD